MAVAFIQEFAISSDDRSTTNYDAVSARLNAQDDKPAGLIVHTAGFDEDGGVFRILDIWETKADGDRFVKERLMPIVEELFANNPDAAPPSREGWYELHDVIKG
jgi:hypothetical protein